MSKDGEEEQNQKIESLINFNRVYNNLTECLDGYNSYEKHKQKLKNIKESPLNPVPHSAVANADESEILKLRILNNKICSKEFHESEKQKQMKKKNEKLLGKLIEISKGKMSTIDNRHKVPKYVKLRSLNKLNKKNESERIHLENFRLMQKILNQGPVISTKKLKSEYKEQIKFKKNLMSGGMRKNYLVHSIVSIQAKNSKVLREKLK